MPSGRRDAFINYHMISSNYARVDTPPHVSSGALLRSRNALVWRHASHCGQARWPLLVGRRQDGDLRRAGLLGDRHDIDCGAEKDVFVAPDEQRLRADVAQRLADLRFEVPRLELA